MLDLFPEAEKPVEIIPAKKLSARAAALYVAPADHFQTRPVEDLRLWQSWEEARLALFSASRNGKPASRYSL